MLGLPVLITTLVAISAFVAWIMIRHGALDHPVARSSHIHPTPKGGGVGIAVAYAAGNAVAHAGAPFGCAPSCRTGACRFQLRR